MGKAGLNERTMLEAHLGPAKPDYKPHNFFFALNDVVLARGATAKLIQIDTTIDDLPLTTYRSDGVILSTATGSTGYSLAAGGPVLHPQSEDLLLVPIVSHLSMGYSLVIPSSSVILLQLVSTSQATLSIDGHINIPVFNDSTVTIKKSKKKTRFLRLHKQSYFNTLEEKLRGKK
jgi:NAD+ kinase